ncbi:MAG: PEP-CTERM sorting domain-containing protein [Cyanobacteria bacterium J06649_4]
MNTRFPRGTVAALFTIIPAVTSLIVANPVRAATFDFQENPNLVPQAVPIDRTVNGNTLTIKNAAVLTNTGSTATGESIYTYPFLYSTIDRGSTFVGLKWDNALDAYTTDNYDGLGNRLTVRLTNFTQRIRLDQLADITGSAPLPTAIPCSDPSCPPPSPLPLPPLAQDANDAIPFLSLGSFAPGETKAIDLVIDFDYEDGRIGPVGILPVFSILSATSKPVPEPATAISLILVGSGIALTKRKQAVT